MTQDAMTKLAMAVGICYAAYRFVGNPALKAGAIAVGAVIVAKRLPILGAALA